ncbi:MAG: hypothetical protein PHY80_05895, partial [Rickettsiales bacterium]|nr:hypothetical protein [Rickettsiales bacterium]
MSIVLVVISLLIAGVLGGNSLVKTAKIRSIINQWRDWETSLYAFKIATDKLPGDINDNGKIGYTQDGVAYAATGDVCNACGHYTGEYASLNIGTVAGPWVDLYLAKLSLFKPDPTSNQIGTVWYPEKSQINVILPISKIDKKNAMVYFNYTEHLHINQRNGSEG